MENNLSLSKFPLNDENPFLKQTVEEVSSHIVKKWKNNGGTSRNAILTAVNVNNEPVGHTTFVQQIKVDESKFTKIYLAQFKAFFNLSQPGIRVFGYIMQCMKPSKDTIAFSFIDCMNYTGYKAKSTVYKGMAELLSSGIIARSMEDWKYYINPLIIWNGNRVTFVQDYVKATDKAKRLEGEAKAARHDRIVKEATAWKVNEEVFFNGDEGKETARIIDIDGDNVTLLLYSKNSAITISRNSDKLIRREPLLTFETK